MGILSPWLFLWGDRMPRKPKRPCSYPGCPELYDRRFCKENEKEFNRNYERYKRNPEPHKRYGKALRIIRKRDIIKHPICERCLKENRRQKLNTSIILNLFQLVEVMIKLI